MAALYQAIAEALLRHWRSMPRDQARCHPDQQLAFWTAAMQHLGSAVCPPLCSLNTGRNSDRDAHADCQLGPHHHVPQYEQLLGCDSCLASEEVRSSSRRCLFSEDSSPAAGARRGSSQVNATANITDSRS